MISVFQTAVKGDIKTESRDNLKARKNEKECVTIR